MQLEIRSRRLSAEPKITVAEIAQLSGVSRSNVRKIETGNTNNPGIKTVSAIQEALAQLEAQRAAQRQAATTP